MIQRYLVTMFEPIERIKSKVLIENYNRGLEKIQYNILNLKQGTSGI